jgi:ferredoxin
MDEGAATARATVDADLCMGSEECVRLLPDAFVIDEDLGVSVPLDGADATRTDRLLQAARNCPTNAIEVRDSDGAVLFGSAR